MEPYLKFHDCQECEEPCYDFYDLFGTCPKEIGQVKDNDVEFVARKDCCTMFE